MKLTIEIITREINQRLLANKHNHLRKVEVELEIKSLNKALEKLNTWCAYQSLNNISE